MKEKTEGKFTVRVVESLPKTLQSRDSADRLVRAVITLWRSRPITGGRDATTLVLDFDGVHQVSESAAGAIIEFREEFSEDKDPKIEFSNMSPSVDETFAAVEKSLRAVSGRIKTRKRKHSGFSIKL